MCPLSLPWYATEQGGRQAFYTSTLEMWPFLSYSVRLRLMAQKDQRQGFRWYQMYSIFKVSAMILSEEVQSECGHSRELTRDRRRHGGIWMALDVGQSGMWNKLSQQNRAGTKKRSPGHDEGFSPYWGDLCYHDTIISGGLLGFIALYIQSCVLWHVSVGFFSLAFLWLVLSVLYPGCMILFIDRMERGGFFVFS